MAIIHDRKNIVARLNSGLLAEPWEAWEHLAPLAGRRRRKEAPVVLSIPSSFHPHRANKR